jgi:hypothetical protein
MHGIEFVMKQNIVARLVKFGAMLTFNGKQIADVLFRSPMTASTRT